MGAFIELIIDNFHIVALLTLGAILFANSAFFRRYPNRLLVVLCLIPFMLSLSIVFFPLGKWAALIVDGVIAIVALIDSLLMPPIKKLEVERNMLRVVSLAKSHHVELVITNRTRRTIPVAIKDDVPVAFEANKSEFNHRLPGRSRATFSYHFDAMQRGLFEYERVYLKTRSPLRLWKQFHEVELKNEVHVYPDLKQLSEYALLARTNRLSMLGLRRTRRIGQDNEFERLRDYTGDDNHRHIDWRATARRNKLTVRDFQANQSQRVIFMVDCGRMMTNEVDDLTLLDHSLNSMLMLSYVALQKGDSVGVICFSDRVLHFVPPRGGMGQMNHLLHAVFNQQAEFVESRYDQAFLYLATHCLKRSLVVLFSNVIDEVNSNQVETYLATIAGRHLPIGILLRDHRLFDAADKRPESVREVYHAAVAAEILSWRHQVLINLERKGVLALDVFPEDMTAPLINQYLEVKARHLL